MDSNSTSYFNLGDVAEVVLLAAGAPENGLDILGPLPPWGVHAHS